MKSEIGTLLRRSERKYRVSTYTKIAGCRPGRFSVIALASTTICIVQPTLLSHDALANDYRASLTTMQQAIRRLIPKRIERLLGVHMIDEKGRTLFSHQGYRQFNPASNMKLITTTMALEELGPNFRFRTVLAARQHRSRILGPIVVNVGGDPTLDTPAIQKMVGRLVEAGVRTVDGPIVVDQHKFDIPLPAPGYVDFESSAPYRAPVSGATINGNVIRVAITPASKRRLPAKVSVEPKTVYSIVNGRLLTTRRRSRYSVVSEPLGKTRTAITIGGRIRSGTTTRKLWIRVQHPARYLGAVILSALASEGIRVRRRTIKVTRRRYDTRRFNLVVEHRSKELFRILRITSKRSVNLAAELLMLGVGQNAYDSPATYEKGLRAMRVFLRRWGIKRINYKLTNGSGLARDARFRPADLAEFVRRIGQDFRLGSDVLATLPVSGIDGTLKRVYEGSRAMGYVRAKTGTLDDVVCLSGLAAYGPRRAYFSMMSMGITRRALMRRRQIRITEMLVDHLRRITKQNASYKTFGSSPAG